MPRPGAGFLPFGAHLVGSVPLASAEEVFRTLGRDLGDRVRRLPDGETGPRAELDRLAVPGAQLAAAVRGRAADARVVPRTAAVATAGRRGRRRPPLRAARLRRR